MTDPLIALGACSSCRACDLATTRQQVVVGRGNPNARLMLIGEAPGAVSYTHLTLPTIYSV